MSVDYFLWSKQHNRKVMIGSIGMSGTRFWPDAAVKEFVLWAIEESIQDVRLVSEHELNAEELEEE